MLCWNQGSCGTRRLSAISVHSLAGDNSVARFAVLERPSCNAYHHILSLRGASDVSWRLPRFPLGTTPPYKREWFRYVGQRFYPPIGNREHLHVLLRHGSDY